MFIFFFFFLIFTSYYSRRTWACDVSCTVWYELCLLRDEKPNTYPWRNIYSFFIKGALGAVSPFSLNKTRGFDSCSPEKFIMHFLISFFFNALLSNYIERSNMKEQDDLKKLKELFSEAKPVLWLLNITLGR